MKGQEYQELIVGMMLSALRVLTLDRKVRQWLKRNDRKALEQAEEAIRMAESIAIRPVVHGTPVESFEKYDSARTTVEATLGGNEAECSRCGRPFFMGSPRGKVEYETGLCSICLRDVAFERVFGSNWRKVILDPQIRFHLEDPLEHLSVEERSGDEVVKVDSDG